MPVYHAAYEELMRFKTKKQFNWEKQTQVMTKLRTWTVKTFYPADRIPSQSKKVSVIHFNWMKARVTIKYYTWEVTCVNSERVENCYKNPDLRQEVKAKVSLEPLVRPRVNCSWPITLFDASISVSFVKGEMCSLGWLVDWMIVI